MQMFGEPKLYCADNMYGPDSKYADPNFKPKPLKFMSPNHRAMTLEEIAAYFAWCERTAWDSPDEETMMEDDADNPVTSKYFDKSSSGEANTQDSEMIDLEQDLSAEVEAEDEMTDISDNSPAELQEEDMTDAPDLSMPDWYDVPIASSTTTNCTPAPFPMPKPHHSAKAVPRHQDMNNVAATEFPGLGMLKPSSHSIDHSSSSSSSRVSATPTAAPQAQAPVVAAPSKPLPDLSMLENKKSPQSPSTQTGSSGATPGSGLSQGSNRPVSSVTKEKSFSQYRHTPLIPLFLNEVEDATTSSVPGLNDEIENQVFGSDLLSEKDQPWMIALCEAIVAMSINDRSKLFQNVPQTAGFKRAIDGHGLYPIAKRTCLAAEPSSCPDESASKTRHISGIHASLLAYQDAEPDKVAASRSGSTTKKLGNAKSSSDLQRMRKALPSSLSARLSKGAIRSSKAISLSALKSKVRPPMQSGAGLHSESRSVTNAGTNSASTDRLSGLLAKTSISPASTSQTIEKQVISSSAAANHSFQRVDLPPTNFAPSKKPGCFGISTSKSNAISSSTIASNSNTQRINKPPTASLQSAKPSSTSGNNQMSNVLASSPDTAGNLTPRLGSTSGHFVQSKKPGTWLNQKAKRDAVPVAPVASVVPTSERSDSIMELDVPVSSALAASTESVSAMEVDRPQNVAAKPLTQVTTSDAVPDSDKNGSGPFHFAGSLKLPVRDGRATQGNHTARQGGQAPSRRPAQTGTDVPAARHAGLTRNGFRDRSDKERKELEAMLRQVPDQFKIDVHKVIQSQVCDMVPALSAEEVRSIPDLAKTGPGASVRPHPFADKFRSKADSGRDIMYFRELRQQTPQVWLDLITMILQSGRSPKDVLDSEYDRILGAEWVTDLERIDKVAREGSHTVSKAFFTREDVSVTLRPLFDQAASKMMTDGCKVFEIAVKNWIKHDKSGDNKALFIQCLERAGWVQAHSHFTRFMGWATGDAPPAIKRACFNHFRWAFPRLLRAVSAERLERTQPFTVE